MDKIKKDRQGLRKTIFKICIINENAFNKARDKAHGNTRDLTCVSCSGVRGGSGGCISPVPYKAP